MARMVATDKRVVIESVSPAVDGGRFPAKATVGDPVTVAASVFADGHDSVSSVLRYQRAGARSWAEVPMQFLGNDRWQAMFTPDELGMWQFEIVGWVDHFETWLIGTTKKFDAGLDIDVELLQGAELYAAAADRAGAKAARELASVAAEVGGPGRSQADRLAVATAPEAIALARKHPDRSRASKSDARWPLVVDREKAVFSTWYELFPRSWSKREGEHGTFADVEARLDYVAGMGFDVLYLPPIHPVGTTFRKGPDNTLSAGHDDPGVPWAIGSELGGHTAINPDLGTIEDFRSLRDAAGARGIELALDIAFQCSPDHPWVTEHPEWFRHRPDGTIQYAENPPKKYQDIYPLDFESEDREGLWTALKGVFDHWIGEGIRIFRVDNPHTKAFPFWDWVLEAIREEHPDVIMLAEAFTRPAVMNRLAKAGFNQSYTYFAWRTTKHDLIGYMADLARVSHFFRPTFWPNTPDILTEELQTGGRAAFISRYVLAATLSPACGIYGPAYELMEHVPLRPGSEEYLKSEKYQIRSWDLDRADSLAPVITRVNHARMTRPALHRMNGLTFHPTDNDALLAYSKGMPGEAVLVVVSLDPHHPQSGWVSLDLGAIGVEPESTFEVHDLLTERRYRWEGERNFIRLEPAGVPAHVFAVRAETRNEEGPDDSH
ncbi:MAG TPA: alpha-1,4-glucan--maltose-1-phosphate maltosyltransferase [Acidimicrobiia bacterium]|jgi:starch synthase (maltosyl-transferring)|nr:alpha-1,4-glucan--maltose-1-phosphate maltosyltransferase [Acidimicrobiia bacterium]